MKKILLASILLIIAITLGYVFAVNNPFNNDKSDNKTGYYKKEPSNRVKINMGNTRWKFSGKGVDPYPDVIKPEFDDSKWENVGIPHSYNADDTYTNEATGRKSMFLGTVWYRKHFKLDSSYEGRKIFIEFEGVQSGCAVYINGKFLKGNTLVPQQVEATHVGGYIPFVVDITPYVNLGDKENVLAVRVDNSDCWYEGPPGGWWYQTSYISTQTWCGQGMGGIFRPVSMHITDKVHVPLNTYSVVKNWGTHISTLSASAETAKINIKTNVQNHHETDKKVDLVVDIVDTEGNVVLNMTNSKTVSAGKTLTFDNTGDISNPKRWFPAKSLHGTPYMYKVYHIIKIDGKTVDVFESPLGIRTIAWGEDYPVINGYEYKELIGFGTRYEYPGLGSAVPEEQQWRDIKIAADAGLRFYRPGHSPSSREAVEACDTYGVVITQPSGDNEATLGTGGVRWAYKQEYHRDLIVRDRNNPSVIIWELSNGELSPGMLPTLKEITQKWDPINTRPVAPRGTYGNRLDTQPDLEAADIIATVHNAVKTKLNNPTKPVYNGEHWTAYSARQAWDADVENTEKYISDIKAHKDAKVFGFVHWYLAESQGETRPYLEGKPEEEVKTLGCSILDGNRIPRLIYKVYKNAALIPFELEPGVVIGNHWNRSGDVDVKVWSNCPRVELFLNDVSLGIKTPEDWSGSNPFRSVWPNVTWESGTLRAVGLNDNSEVVSTDEIRTAGEPHHIELSVEPNLIKPNGSTFVIKANGSDAGFVLAKIVDIDGNICPTADNNITFSVSGPGVYCGSFNQYVTPGKDVWYHSPRDPELAAEAGQIKVAVRSTFRPGKITVNASSPGLKSDSTTFTTVEVKEGLITPPPIIMSGGKTEPKSQIAKTTNTNINLAINRPALSSSAMKTSLSANKVNDGSMETKWVSASNNSEWIEINLGAQEDVDKIILYWGDAYAKSYKIRFKPTSVAKFYDVYSTTTSDGETDIIDGLYDGKKVQYIRIYGVEPAKKGYELFEVEVYSKP